MTARRGIRARTLVAALFALAAVGRAAVLPDDRADFLWHDWQGGGVTVDGPSVLVRKSVNDSLSFAANYYVDMISSASVEASLLRVTVEPDETNGLRARSQVMVDKAMTVMRGKVGPAFGRLGGDRMLEVERRLALFLGIAR